MSKKYSVVLTDRERAWIRVFIDQEERSLQEQTRARVLLKVDEGPQGPAWTDRRTADALTLSAGGVASIRRRYCQRGLRGCLERRTPERPPTRKLDGERKAELIRLASSHPPAGRSAWSLRLLADEMTRRGIVDSVSHECVRQTLERSDVGTLSAANG